MTTLAPPGEPRRVAYLYLLPGLVVFGLFVLAPLLHSAWLSLFQWDGVTAGECCWRRRCRARVCAGSPCSALSFSCRR